MARNYSCPHLEKSKNEKKRKMNGFLGPWFCSLFFNTATKCKKKTHLETHTYPHLTVDALNKNLFNEEGKRIRKQQQEANEDHCWIIILKVGPFNELHHAQNFQRQWAHKTRGKWIRVRRGVKLFKLYFEEYKLKLWVQRETQENAVNSFFQQEIMEETIAWKDDEEEDVEEDEEEEEVVFAKQAFEEGCLEELTIGGIENLLGVGSRTILRSRKKKKMTRTIKL